MCDGIGIALQNTTRSKLKWSQIFTFVALRSIKILLVGIQSTMFQPLWSLLQDLNITKAMKTQDEKP